jgi:hypothetical protein
MTPSQLTVKEAIEPKRFLSLGMGVQSTAIYFMSSMGILPRMEAAIFADTGKEKAGTLRYLDFLMDWKFKNDGLPIITLRDKNLYEDLLKSENSTGQRFSSIPAYTLNEDGSQGMLRRQCTNEYKIEQVEKAIRLFLDKPSLRGEHIEVWLGISLEEIERMTIPETNWRINVYPFCGFKISRSGSEADRIFQRLTRNDIVKWYERQNLPLPPKSSCVFCPFQSDASYKEMKEREPDDFEAACKVDDAIRNSSKKGNTQPIFLHDSMTPLRDIDFPDQAPDLWKGNCSDACHN